MSTNYIVTRKEGMTRITGENGGMVSVTVLSVVPTEVKGARTLEKDGYVATIIGTDANKTECRADEVVSDIAAITPHQPVILQGVSKGKGFAGTIKRHGFHRGPSSHGSRNVRKPGSIGSMYPQHVIKGIRMAGRMGNRQTTIKTVVEAVIPQQQLILVRGAVPGSRKSTVYITA